ncbi:DUF58 domain-containing protein [Pseudomarimonas salicorniae]|uniref:DUF58 domain-containing protein n=1 Tax=Pseudomarimonas salicorniae TaxID=2933270 RepID=A0ABT0GJ33_9GAMM|nr:DUF58 domain-containing protein [Lysobacter sp. CAU 1642]MCK7594560.1 DUF58 domain-containing protein [Lysobacter sp. CAU 1642]
MDLHHGRQRPTAQPGDFGLALSGAERIRSSVASLAALRGYAGLLRGTRAKAVRQPRAAQSHSPFRGRGMEYAESRPYSPGDDARHVDWRVSARTGQLHSKLYHAERERISAVLFDSGPWMAFGTRGCFKTVQAARLAALFAWDALGRGDRVAAASNHPAQALLAPAGGERGVLRLLAQLCRWQPLASASTPSQPGLAGPLARLERLLRPGSRLLLTVDAHTLDEGALRRLAHLRIHHDLMVALLVDPLEQRAPSAPALPVSDGETTLWLDAGAGTSRTRWNQALGSVWRTRLGELHRAGISARAVSTTDSPVDALRDLMRGALFEPDR